jgi:enoyl-CoA hydratase/carnithine racemase
MIERSEDDGIITLRLAHGKVSALDLPLGEELRRQLAASRDARAVILTGTGSSFSAGVDLFRMVDSGADYIERFWPLLTGLLTDLFEFPRPVVAAANGHAIAGGCLMVAACDYRLMSGGKIGVPELLVGVPFPAVAIELLRFACGRDAQSLIYSGKTVTPDDARLAGIIDEVATSDFLHVRAEIVARELAAIDPRNFAITKRQLRGEALDRILKMSGSDREAMKIWSLPEVHQHIRDYLGRTVHQKH